ncbi:hypothetical protein D5S17_07800 [Pseudonocardiaceae bacterium YIM PH 21723]|nr:hypothetical protein D5S17_07800 [Pseudonocardiaceae bacterium YIM PH 21723]
MGRKGWVITGGVLAAVMVLLGASAVWVFWLGKKSEHESQVYWQQVDKISVNLDVGSIQVRPGVDGEVRVERDLVWAFGRPQYHESWTGNEFSVVGDPCDQLACEINYTLTVPRSTVLELRSGVGDVTVGASSGGLRVDVGQGDIRLTDVGGAQVHARTDTGELSGTGLRAASLEAMVTTGSAALRFAAGPTDVRAETSTGDVTINVPQGGTYRVSTEAGSGSIQQTLNQNSSAQASISAKSGTGDIRLGYA